MWLLEQSRSGSSVAAAQRRASQWKEQQFRVKAREFVEAWTEMANEFNNKGAFNVKKARKASKAFHELERTEGWPRQRE